MDTSITSTVTDELVEASAFTEANFNEVIRANTIRYNSSIRRALLANEIALKGLYTDWLFSKLNLNSYR